MGSRRQCFNEQVTYLSLSLSLSLKMKELGTNTRPVAVFELYDRRELKRYE